MIRIAVLGSFTIDLLAKKTEECLRLDEVEVRYGNYNGYSFEILDEQSWLYSFIPNIVILHLHSEDILGYTSEQSIKQIWSEFEKLLKLLKKRLPETHIIVSNFYSSAFKLLYTFE